MTSTPDPGPDPEGTVPDVAQAADSGTGDQVDVRSLARQRPAAPAWLLATEIDGPAGEVFTASPVPGPQPRAFGGDVLLRVAPGAGPEPGTAISVAVWAVAAGVLVPVAAWDLPDDGSWPERIRATVTFAMSALTELGEHAGLGELDAVDLDAVPRTAVPGLPWPLAGNRRVAAVG